MVLYYQRVRWIKPQYVNMEIRVKLEGKLLKKGFVLRQKVGQKKGERKPIDHASVLIIDEVLQIELDLWIYL